MNTTAGQCDKTSHLAGSQRSTTSILGAGVCLHRLHLPAPDIMLAEVQMVQPPCTALHPLHLPAPPLHLSKHNILHFLHPTPRMWSKRLEDHANTLKETKIAEAANTLKQTKKPCQQIIESIRDRHDIESSLLGKFRPNPQCFLHACVRFNNGLAARTLLQAGWHDFRCPTEGEWSTDGEFLEHWSSDIYGVSNSICKS